MPYNCLLKKGNKPKYRRPEIRNNIACRDTFMVISEFEGEKRE